MAFYKELSFISRTQHNCTSTQCIFNRHASDTGHQQGTISYPQSKGLPRSTVNSSVSITFGIMYGNKKRHSWWTEWRDLSGSRIQRCDIASVLRCTYISIRTAY